MLFLEPKHNCFLRQTQICRQCNRTGSVSLLPNAIRNGFSLQTPSNPSHKRRKCTDPSAHIQIISQELKSCSAFPPCPAGPSEQRIRANSSPRGLRQACSIAQINFFGRNVILPEYLLFRKGLIHYFY